ncbi:hypothetical protein GCM10023187_53190 [Nibrella viscosa]|uniref:Uncharacterized protein n=1 Tax=Nibrella viscosa TaxID=1084524 RepID=A0ABP8KYB2_9BACT
MLLTDEQLREIAGELQSGMRCYLHRQSGELVALPDADQFPDADTEPWQEEQAKLARTPQEYIPVRPLNSHDTFRMMEQFVQEEVSTDALRSRLLRALDQPKPFRHFKAEIDTAGEYRQRWFASQ